MPQLDEVIRSTDAVEKELEKVSVAFMVGNEKEAKEACKRLVFRALRLDLIFGGDMTLKWGKNTLQNETSE